MGDHSFPSFAGHQISESSREPRSLLAASRVAGGDPCRSRLVGADSCNRRHYRNAAF